MPPSFCSTVLHAADQEAAALLAGAGEVFLRCYCLYWAVQESFADHGHEGLDLRLQSKLDVPTALEWYSHLPSCSHQSVDTVCILPEDWGKFLAGTFSGDGAQQPATVDPTRTPQNMKATIHKILSEVLGSFSGSDSEPLMAAGLTSLAAIRLTELLGENLGVELPTTLVFDYPSIELMAQHISTFYDIDRTEAQSTGEGHVLERVLACIEELVGRPVESSEPLMSVGLTSLAA
eukprot:scaffold3900_cov787-Pavlova_lutheri.AAC.1